MSEALSASGRGRQRAESENRVLGLAGQTIRQQLKRQHGLPHFGATPEDHERAAAKVEPLVRQAMANTAELEEWASVMLAAEAGAGTGLDTSMFSFDELPTHLREVAKEGMAMAMLAWQSQGQRRATERGRETDARGEVA